MVEVDGVIIRGKMNSLGSNLHLRASFFRIFGDQTLRAFEDFFSLAVCWEVQEMCRPFLYLQVMYTMTGWWWLEPWNFMTFHSVGNMFIPTDELIFFRGVAQSPTRWLLVAELCSGNSLHVLNQLQRCFQSTDAPLIIQNTPNESSVIFSSHMTNNKTVYRCSLGGRTS